MNRILTDAELKGLLEDSTTTPSSYEPKDIFIDEVNPYKYIELDSNTVTFDRINLVLHKNLKMSLIYGSPGTGKSMFLSRLHNNLSVQSQYSILIASPILDDRQLFGTIGFEIFKDSSLKELPNDFNNLIIALEENEEYLLRTRPILLLDESQLYNNSTLEKIRILADTQKVRVIFAVHQLKDKDIFTQEHFKSRIWERIELRNASVNELKVYIQKKLMGGSMLELANQFSKKIVKIIFKITKGNYRVTNNLIYAYLNNYPQLYKPQFNSKPLKVRKREIEITAIQIQFIRIKSDLDVQHLPTAEQEWQNLQKKLYLKLFVVFIIPISVYLIVKIMSYQNIDIISRNPPIKKIESQAIEENISFQMPKYNEIIEVSDEEELNINEINASSVTAVIEDNISENNVSEDIAVDIPEENITIIKQSIIKVENNPIQEVKVEILENIPLKDISINPIFFKDAIQIYPDLSFLDNFQDYIPRKIEDSYILSLKSEFKENANIPLLLNIINYYKRIKDYENVYNFSLQLNNADLNSTTPYLNLIEILQIKNEIQDIEKIKEGCKNCEF